MSEPTPTPPAEARTNTLFAFEPAHGVGFSNPFPETHRLTLPTRDGEEPGIEVVAGATAKVRTYFDAATGACAYLWGTAAHPDIPVADVLKWVVGVVDSDDRSRLCQVVGTYIVLIDDRRNRRVRMVSDVLGVRPWLVGHATGRLICGCDAWAMQQAGIDVGGVNYDAVASWLRFIFDCSGQSLFTNLSAIGYGVVANWEGGKYSESRYFTLNGGLAKPSRSELIEGMHERISRTFDALTRDLSNVSIALSGGFDSRYLVALASQRKHLKVETFCVRDREAEGMAATMVAEALGVPLNVLRTDGSIWNMYSEPYHFTPGGFPMTKQLSHLAASQRPGVPFLSGFFGDPMNRGSLDRLEGKTEREIEEELPVAFRRHFTLKHTLARFDLLDQKVLARADERILRLLRERFPVWAHTGHPIIGVGLFSHQRFYMSNNIVQLLHLTEPIAPFVSWESLQYKFQNDPTCFSYDVYGELLKTKFPQIGHIPHNSKLGSKNDLIAKPSRWIRTWATAVLKGLHRSDSLSCLNRRKGVARLIGAAMGRRDVEVVALFLYRLHMLDARLREARIDFDWQAM